MTWFFYLGSGLSVILSVYGVVGWLRKRPQLIFDWLPPPEVRTSHDNRGVRTHFTIDGTLLNRSQERNLVTGIHLIIHKDDQSAPLVADVPKHIQNGEENPISLPLRIEGIDGQSLQLEFSFPGEIEGSYEVSIVLEDLFRNTFDSFGRFVNYKGPIGSLYLYYRKNILAQARRENILHYYKLKFRIWYRLKVRFRVINFLVRRNIMRGARR